MITYKEYGDIFNIPQVTNYAHGCNCAGAMGKGIALQFKERFPEMYKEYKRRCAEKAFDLGDVFMYQYSHGFVFNLGTQATWKTKASIKAIEVAFEKMLLLASQNKIDKIALPKIGAGLGGLQWQEVKSVIERLSIKYPQIDLIVVENFKPE